VVDAFLAAARAGDFTALLKVLDPNVVVRADFGPRGQGYVETLGAEAVAATALTFTKLAGHARRALVNGAAGIVVIPPRGAYAVMSFSISHGRIREIDILADTERLGRLDLGGLVQA
jgi:RNA polymerase sigma-70 factor (ECF subfamily)